MIKLHEVHKIYMQGKRGFHALKDISLYFEAGETVFVHGKSGCGKTTLLNIIGGLDRPSSGDMVIGDRLTSKFRESEWDYFRNHNIGFIFQQFNLIEHLPILENVALNAKLAGANHSRASKMAEAMLQKVGLGAHIHKNPTQLSGGERQRVGIARALINDPDIILADEPTGNLDRKTGREIMDLITKVGQDKLVIVVTHDTRLAKAYASRLIHLRDGRVESDSAEKDARVRISLRRERHRKSLAFKEGLRLAWFNLRSRVWRSGLISAGLALGILGLILVNSLFTTVRNSLEAEGETLRENPELTITQAVDTDTDPGDFLDAIHARHEYFTDLFFTPYQNLSILRNVTSGADYRDPRVVSDPLGAPLSETTQASYGSLLGDGRLPEAADEFAIPLSMAESFFYRDVDLDSEELWERLEGNEYEVATTYQYSPASMQQVRETCRIQENWDGSPDSLPEDFFDEFDHEGGFKEHLQTLGPYRDQPLQEDDTAFFCNDYEALHWQLDESLPEESETLTLVGVFEDPRIERAVFYGSFLESIGSHPQGYAPDEAGGSTPQYSLQAIGYLADEHVDEKTSIIRAIEDDGYQVRETTQIAFNPFGGIAVLFTYIAQFLFNAIVAVAVVTAGLMLLMILYISVLERTREIGLIRAMGGTRKDIRRIFAGETTMIGLSAGLISVVLSIVFVLIANTLLHDWLHGLLSRQFGDIPEGPLFSIDGGLLALAVFISILIAVISGLIPSVIASRKQPIEALRND